MVGVLSIVGWAMKSETQSLIFPASALVGSLGELSKVLSEGTEVPEEFCFAAGLTAFGSMCGTHLKLNIGCHVEPRLYTVLLGESYQVKKSTAMRKVLEFFEPVHAHRLSIETGLIVSHGVGRRRRTGQGVAGDSQNATGLR